jgi:hypothetical protein
MWLQHVCLTTESAGGNQCTVSAIGQLVAATPHRLPDSTPGDDDLDPHLHHGNMLTACAIVPTAFYADTRRDLCSSLPGHKECSSSNEIYAARGSRQVERYAVPIRTLFAWVGLSSGSHFYLLRSHTRSLRACPDFPTRIGLGSGQISPSIVPYTVALCTGSVSIPSDFQYS